MTRPKRYLFLGLWAFNLICFALTVYYVTRDDRLSTVFPTFQLSPDEDLTQALPRYLAFHEAARQWVDKGGPLKQGEERLQFFVYNRQLSGLGNRIRGMASYLVLGMLMGRITLADWPEPCTYNKLVNDVHHFDCGSWGRICNGTVITTAKINTENPLDPSVWSDQIAEATVIYVNPATSFISKIAEDEDFAYTFRSVFGSVARARDEIERMLVNPQQEALEKVSNVVKNADLSLPGLSVHARMGDDTFRHKAGVVFLDEIEQAHFFQYINRTLCEMIEERGKANLFLTTDHLDKGNNWKIALSQTWGARLDIYDIPKEKVYHLHYSHQCDNNILADLLLQCFGTRGVGTYHSSFSTLIARMCDFSAKEYSYFPPPHLRNGHWSESK